MGASLQNAINHFTNDKYYSSLVCKKITDKALTLSYNNDIIVVCIKDTRFNATLNNVQLSNSNDIDTIHADIMNVLATDINR